MTNFNLSYLRQRFKIALVVSVIGIAIVAILVITSFDNKKTSQVPYKQEPLPTIIPTKLQQPSGFQGELDKIKGILPYQGPNYSIRYRSSINTVEIEIDAPDRNGFITTKKTVEDFLKSKGVQDLCALTIFWQTPENSLLYKELSAKDIITTNCPVSPR